MSNPFITKLAKDSLIGNTHKKKTHNNMLEGNVHDVAS